jgi:hypothetical protein
MKEKSARNEFKLHIKGEGTHMATEMKYICKELCTVGCTGHAPCY